MKFKSTAVCGITFLLLGACSVTQPTAIPYHNIGTNMFILGYLGLPVGQEVTITGHKETNGPLHIFTVDTIDGKALPVRVVVGIRGIEKWPDHTAATLKGCEVGTLRYLHLDETNYGPHDERWKGSHQELFLGFDVSEIIDPAGLKLDREK